MKIIKLFLFLAASLAASFSFAALEYSPANVGVWYPPNVGPAGYHEASTAEALCPLVSPNSFSGTISYPTPDTARCHSVGGGWFSIARRFDCPTGYTRDPAKAATDPQACFRDVEDPPPPTGCAARIGESVVRTLACFNVTCPSGFHNTSTGWTCNPSSSMVWSELDIPDPLSIDGCAASLSDIAANPHVSPTLQAGATGSQMLCDVTYILTGEDAPPETPTPPEGSQNPPPGNTQVSPEASAPPTGTGTSNGQSGSGSGTGNTGGTSGTGSGTNAPCVPTAETPCTQTGTGSYNCVPTEINPCNGAGNAQTANCELSPVCTGDAVQCAQVIQTHKSVCELNKTMREFPEELQDNLAAVNAAASSSGDSVTSNAESLLDSHLNDFQTAFNSAPSGACLDDVVITPLAGVSITIPLSDLCSFLTFLKLLLHLGVDFIAIRMITRAVTGA